MLCPVCSHRVARDAAACPRCGTNFRQGDWRPVEERRQFPGPGRVGLQAAGVVLASALIAVLIALVANPPAMAEGDITLSWLLSVAGHLASIGLPLFLALSGAGLVAVIVNARHKGMER